MNVILWIRNTRLPHLNHALNVLNKLYGSVNVLAATGSYPGSFAFNGTVVRNIDKRDLASYDCDIIVLCGKDVSIVPALKEASELKIDPDKIILDRTICAAGFTLEKYRRLRHSQLTIISRLCWGGFIYNSLGMRFLSPTINLRFPPKDFLRLLSDPMFYMSQELKFDRFDYDNGVPDPKYPIFKLCDVEVQFNHYGGMSVAEAKKIWDKRATRINWFNTLVMMETEDRTVLEEFSRLPFAKKICFVPFRTDLDCAYYVNTDLIKENPLWWHVNTMAQIKLPPCFDFFEALMYGKKVQLY